MVMDWQRMLPDAQASVHTREEQTFELWRSEPFTVDARQYQVRVWVEWFDRCGNGSNTFYYHEDVVTAHTNHVADYVSKGDPGTDAAFAAIPQEWIGLELWNGCHPFGPWYYIENTVYHAGDRDHNGLRAGEKRHLLNGKTKIPVWRLAAVTADGREIPLYELTSMVDNATAPDCDFKLEYRPVWTIGEGKQRELEYARRTAIWPEATDAQLCDPNLATALRERLPRLVADFRRVIESLGFEW